MRTRPPRRSADRRCFADGSRGLLARDGCNRYEALLALEGRRVSAITIQKILNDKELGTRQQRWLALEKQNADQVIELTPEQARFLEKLNP